MLLSPPFQAKIKPNAAVTRSHRQAEKLPGLDWSGTFVHDGWSVYDRFNDDSRARRMR